MMMITEQFLYFIWQFRQFNTTKLFTTAGDPIEILNPGSMNRNAGPDFSKATLSIAGTVWVGNVEVHVRSSDWNVHQHQYDDVYQSVILHVVYDHDLEIYRLDGTPIPVFLIKEYFSAVLHERYQTLMELRHTFPCEKQLHLVAPIVYEGTLSRMIAERFEHKSSEILRRLTLLKGNWDETFYFFIARSFGFNVNSLPFEMLAISLPQQIFAKHKNNQFQIEALIFGQAGLLNEVLEDTYPRALHAEYEFLRKKYKLQPINRSNWKFLRMRPQNFPTVRLAQFSALISNSNHLFSKVLELEKLEDISSLFKALPVNGYWQRHYHFSKLTTHVNVQLGADSIANIIINTICQLLFSYGKYTSNPDLIDRAFLFLTSLPPERNTIINQYVSSGMKPENAMMSQAILQLNKYHCNQKKCLNCGIGIKILNR